MSEFQRDPLPALAVVGLSLKFPEDAVSSDAFWNMIIEGRCASKEFPPDRFNIDAHYNPDPNRLDSLSNRGGHFVTEDPSLFDAPFFSITAAEASAMDPQQRLALETSYRAFEDAGLTMERLARSKTCVYTGASSNDYQTMITKDVQNAPKFTATGTCPNMLSNRVSWFFNLSGPSATIDTACSSSLVAIDLACKSIWSGDSSMGIALGVNAILSVETTLSLSNLGLLSPDSRCFSFDSRGNGFARGEGIGALVIRPLEDAVRDGDCIRTVIRSTASNQDGKTPGITMPRMEMQEQLIRDAYQKGGLDMSSTRYFEAHGTGTAVGDPIESKAIGSVFRSVRSTDDPLYIGSVKSNIGHLEGGSGVAGVLKTILALERGFIPPNSENFEFLNPRIDDEFFNIKIAKNAIAWPAEGLRRASVSSFGFGGTNAHIVLDDAFNYLKSRNLTGTHNTVENPVLQQSDDTSDPDAFPTAMGASKLLVWSSWDEKGIERLQEAWKPFLSRIVPAHKPAILHDLAHTLASRRTHHPWKTFAVAGPSDDLTSLADRFAPAQRSLNSPNMAFVFSGQGAQWFAMGRELLSSTPLFLQSIESASTYLGSLGCEWNLLDEFQKSQAESRVNKPEFSQTMCTALQIALVDCLRAWNLIPHAVVGHSSGEIAAAYSAEAITRESAWKIAYQRGRLSGRLEAYSSRQGSMLAVALSAKDVAPYLDAVTLQQKDANLNVACVNSPTSVTVSGHEVLIDALKEQFDEANVFARKLKVGVGYHSAQMREIAQEYEKVLGVLEKPPAIQRPKPQMVSSVTGNWIDSKVLRVPRYWVRNMISPVLFSDALSTVCSGSATNPTKKLDYSHRRQKPIHHLVEVGPHAVLQGACKDILKSLAKEKSVAYLSVIVRNVSALDTTLSAVGNLHCAGYPVDLPSVNIDAVRRPRTLGNLPQYPFDHSRSYWHESLVSKGLRHRRFGRNDLLGTPVPLWNPLEAQWRHIIRPSEIPWVGDHKINGSILYPGMGMLVMAIEGAKQMADSDKAISGFNIRDTSFSAAVRIPSNKDSVETSLFMRPIQDASSKSPSSFNFRLCSYEDDNWIECCAGYIQVVYSTGDQSASQSEDERISQELFNGQVKAYSDLQRKSTSVMDKSAIYDFASRCGLGYGEAFQLISSLSFHRDDDYQVVGRVQRGEKGNETIHPTTLDALIQIALWTLSRSGTEMFPTVVPRSMERMWISHEKLARASQSEPLRAHSTRFDDPHHGIIGDIRAFGDNLKDVLVDVTGLQMNVVSDLATEDDKDDALQDQRCHQFEWKPDPQLLTNKEVLDICTTSVQDNYDLGDVFEEIAFIIFVRVLQTLSDLRNQKYTPAQPHLRKYVDWMIEQERRLNDGEVVFAQEPWISRFKDTVFIEQAEDRVSKVNARGYVVANVSRHLPQLLNGDMNPLTFLFDGTQLKDFYFESLYDTVGVHRLGAYLDVLSNRNNAMRVIEVGAGTGSFTDILMRFLGRTDDESSERRYARWDFTDISRSFFSEAQDFFRAEGDRVQYNSLDIEKEPSGQGFECGTYDMVVASLVLHATHDLKTTLINARKLLKPGGKLVLNELTATDILRTSFIFGLLEGWWLSSESYRKLGPCVGNTRWNDLLQETGFSGVDLALQDYDDLRCWECSILVATAVEETKPTKCESDIEIYYSKVSSKQTSTAEILASYCQPLTRSTVSCLPIEDVPEEVSSTPSLRIFLVDLEKPTLHEMDPQLFFTLQHLICSTADVLWINSGGGLENANPHYRVADGLMRAVSAEDDRKKCYVLSLDQTGEVQNLVHQTTKVINELLRATANNETIDTEYVEDKGLLHIPRLVAPPSLNEDMSSRTTVKHSKTQSFECGVPLQLDSANSNLLRGFQFIQDELAGQPLAPDEIEVQVKCSGVNFRDVLIAVGQLKSPHTGFECAGIVSRTGHACKRFRVGDSVAMLYKGCFSSFIRVREIGAVVKIEPDVSFGDAAAVPVNFATAFIAIHDIARMRPKESILIHAAAGGTGQAAVQIAQNLGAEVFATVGSQPKKQLLMDVYDIPESHIFSSRSTLFASAIKQRTHGRVVDVIFNSLAGESLKASWDCIAPYGRFLEIGIKDILANDRLPMGKFLHNVSFSAINLASMMNDRPEVCAGALECVFQMISQGKLQPVRDVHVYGVGDMESAFRTMQSGKHIGKIVIEMRKDDQVTTVLDTHPSTALDAHGTYIISGGLGGLGRTIATWLVDRGARNLLLLSRSGAVSPKAAELLHELSAKGANVMIPRCDVADEKSLAKALSECQERMPPFKGCIQAAMVLRDASFESMTHQAWQEAVFPKVQGSWNLHQQLPSGMDFFVMLSSVAGVVGTKGQSNYAAGNTFQDALARHRIGLGEKATSLDLGVIGFTGAVVEDAKLAEKFLKHSPFIVITEMEMHALLDMYCDPHAGPYTASTCQTVVRLAPRMERINNEIEAWIGKPLFRRLLPQNGPGASTTSSADSANVAAMLGEAQSLAEASAAVIQALTAKLSKALSIAIPELDANKPLHQYGVDSLVAVELRSWLTKEVQADIAVFDILGSSTISSVGQLATSKSKLKGEKW